MQHQMTNGTLYKNALAQQQPGYTALKLENEFSLLRALDEAFADVEGQDHACQAIKEQLFGILDKKSKNGPAATFLFAGPPAVGKTMLAQKIGEALGRPFERFDMSSYSDKEASIYLFGLNKSYKSSQPGRLTTFIKNHPVSVILLDEIEKAHTTVLDNVLQMLDRGTAYDLFYERSFPVNDCIFIFTSNVGASIYDAGDQFNLSAIPTSTVIKALGEEKNPSTGEAYFSRELVSRFASGKLIVFNKLRPEVLHRIAVGQMKKMCDDFYHQYRIESKIDCDVLADLLLFSLGGNADVRSLVGAVREFFLSSIERTMEMIGRNGYDGRVSSIRYRIDRSQMSAEAAEVLEGREMVCVLTFGGHIGGLPKALKERVSLVSADSGFSIADARKLDPAIAVIGVTKQNAAKARVLFDDLVGLGTPCYVYTKEADLPLLYYAESGAVDCFTPRRPLSFNEWIMGAVSGIDLSRAAGRLFRTNKVISFLTSYKYSERTCTAEVTLSDFAVQIAYGGGESSLFAGKAAVPDVTFNDIIGAEEAKNELIPVIRQLKNYRAYRRNGIRIPRGILLDGPPGSGKTSIAKAVANAAGLPFIARNATEFLSRLVGEGEQRIRDLFAAARRYAPAIIFIDEIDCISKDRMGIAAEGYHSEGLTNALLSELDGFDTQNAAPVFVIAATNFDTHSSDSKLDKAFLRRFDKKIHVGLPKLKDRECFLKRELSKYEFSSVSDEKVGSIARRAAGWSLADLNLVVQNAVRHSETGDGFALTDGVLEEAFSSFRAGSRKAYDERDVRKTAYHEAGHAVTAVLLGLKPAYATIVARGDFGGFMQYSDEEKFDLTREECLNRICVSMAGRAADVCFYGNDGISTGASGDLRSATDLAMRMVCVYGMEEDFLFRVDQGMEDPAAAARVREIVTAQYQRALQLIRSNRDKVEAVAGALFERESLTGEELAQLI